ncbi:unnamed protein product [Amoebophrya sp. A25]|nr:unnamed protein product [Amoebophrya sp. A25]|eukprot:GSA25T00017573001.1
MQHITLAVRRFGTMRLILGISWVSAVFFFRLTAALRLLAPDDVSENSHPGAVNHADIIPSVNAITNGQNLASFEESSIFLEQADEFSGDLEADGRQAPVEGVPEQPRDLLANDGIPPAKNQTRPSPYVTPKQCASLAAAMWQKPEVTCKRREVDADTDVCSCKVPLPASVHPQPETVQSVIAAPAVATPGAPPPVQFDPLPEPASPVNPLAPYSPGSMSAVCPFGTACANVTQCVGFDTWGFSKVQQSKYSAASQLLNFILCEYYMPMDGSFEIPLRVNLSSEYVVTDK